MYPVIIIGSGIHGLTVFNSIPKTLKKYTLIIDKYKEPLHQFFSYCDNIQLPYLRSPISHALKEPISIALFQLAKRHGIKNTTQGKYFNPSLKLFKQYAQEIKETINIKQYLQDEVTKLEISYDNVWSVYTKKNPTRPLYATHVIMALGRGVPKLSKNLSHSLPSEKHILHPHYKPIDSSTRKDITIVGGGMTGTQTAIALSQYHNVTLIIKKPLQLSSFDFDPGFVGPKYSPIFSEADVDTKIEILKNEVYTGAITQDVYNTLNNYYKDNKIKIIIDNISTIHPYRQSYKVQSSNGTILTADDIVLATGFNNTHTIPYNTIIANLIEQYDLPLTKEGYPLLTTDIPEWYTNLFLTGHLASMAIGPPANNIIGAMLFCRRMADIWNKW